METAQLTGLARAIVPAGVAYAVGRGWIPAGAAADVGAGLLALLAAGWSIYSNSKPSVVKAVAALPETHVTPAGDILIKDTALRAAAREAATPTTAGNLP